MPDRTIEMTEKQPFEDVYTGGQVPDLAAAITSNMQGTIDAENILLGQIGGSMPTSNVGLWLNGGALYYWNGTTYVPSLISVGDGVHSVTLQAAPTQNRVITVPDRDGTLALTSDIYTPRATITLDVAHAGGSATVDWSASFSFYRLLVDNTGSYAFTNSLPGQTIHIAVAGTHSQTWPAAVFWPSGVAPTQTGTCLYRFDNDAGSIYGKQIGINYS